MGRMITIPIRNVAMPTGDADFDILEVVMGANFRGALHMLSLSTNDTTGQVLNLALVRRSTTGSGGTAITEVADDQGNARTPDPAASRFVTTPGTLASTGAPWQWNTRNELLYIPTPECREVISEGGRLCLHCATAVTGTVNLSGFMKIEDF
jgi:hypothetical protein